MEGHTRADYGTPALPAQRNRQVRYYYSKRGDCISMGLKRPALGNRQAVSAADAISDHALPSPCNGQFEVGSLYEIDHEKLPPKSPIQLKAIRVVKVSEATWLDVTVRFPSTLSLRNYFTGGPAGGGDGCPELDERFVMSSNQAAKILRGRVPSSRLGQEKHLECFWLVASKAVESAQIQLWTSPTAEVKEMVGGQDTPMGGCLLALKGAGLTGWGIRRKVKYIGRHRENPSWSSNTRVEEADKQLIVVERSLDRKEEEEEEDEEEKVGKKRVREAYNKEKKKRKRYTRDGREKKKPRHGKEEKEKKKIKGEEDDPERLARGFTDRWSSERYAAAELKLMEITRGLGAGLGNPILRQELREEARKHIGDTGLLDHLLKHMAGKMVGDGTERFRRRHNAEGAMEYWLEPADLQEIRRKAGVADPYWVPPLGWKLGDAMYTCSCGAECMKELIQVKEESAAIKREVEQLSALLKQDRKTQCEAESGSNKCQEDYKGILKWKIKAEEEMVAMSSCFQALKADYERLMQWKSNVEEEMAGTSSYVQALKEEMRLLKGEKDSVDAVAMEAKGRGEDGDDKVAVVVEKRRTTDTNPSSTNNDRPVIPTTTSNDAAAIIAVHSCSGNDNNNNKTVMSAGGKARAVRRSGFRICKPQGTFLWPTMGDSSAAGISGSGGRAAGTVVQGGQQGMVPPATASTSTLEDHHLMLFGVPTPPSASSATSAPKLLLLHTPPSPVLPRTAAHPEVAVVPHFPSQQLRQELRGGERTGSSENLCPSVYCNIARASTAPMLGSGGADSGRYEGRKREAPAASWAKEGARWSHITTDLALATPNPYL